jgi:lysophospholipase L1-like esterase
MSRVKTYSRAAALLALAVTAAGCDPEVRVLGTEAPAGGEMFRNYVALGNSITAGYQSSGINDSTQRRSYANLFAQAVGTRFAYPQLAAPGCPPPIVNFATQSRGTGLTSNTCALRSDAGVTDRLNNVAVPGALVIDLTTSTTASSNLLTTLVLGGKTQAQRALDVDPTFASIWIGNNDVLGAAVRGVLVPNAAVGSPGVTPVDIFNQRFDAITSELLAANPDLEGALFGVVQVANAPLLFQVGVLLASPQAKAGFDQAAGGVVTIEPNCVAAPTTLVSFALAGQMAAGAHPRIISCGPSALAPNTIVGEAFILTTAEQTSLANTVNAYNTHIQARANALGWAYVDVNPTLTALRANGSIPPFPTTNTAAPFGNYVSHDGVHPRDAAHRLITNLMIQAVNAKYGTTIATITP